MFQDESGEPKSHTLERPSTVASLAVIDQAELDPSTYRIPAGGTASQWPPGHAISAVHFVFSCLASAGLLSELQKLSRNIPSAVCEVFSRTCRPSSPPEGASPPLSVSLGQLTGRVRVVEEHPPLVAPQ